MFVADHVNKYANTITNYVWLLVDILLLLVVDTNYT